MTLIDYIDAQEILDSRGNPTVEVTSSSTRAPSVAPPCPPAPRPALTRRSSCVTATRSRYGGKGVQHGRHQRHRDHRPGDPRRGRLRPGRHRRAADRARRHAQQGQARRQRHPRRVAGRAPTPRRWPTGCRCTATSAVPARGPCPCPMFNILNGGQHAADSTDFQEFMVMPVGLGHASREALRAGAEIFHALQGRCCTTRACATGQGDEGGFAPTLPSNAGRHRDRPAAIERAGYKPGEEVAIALDPAITELIDGEPDARGRVHLQAGQGGPLAQDQRDGRVLGRLDRPLPHRQPRGWPRRGRLGRLDSS